MTFRSEKTVAIMIIALFILSGCVANQSDTSGVDSAELLETGTHTLSDSESSVPSEYLRPISNTSEQGRVERVDYETHDYVNGGNITKAVFVYLPAEYDNPKNDGKQYDILYFMHGYSGTAHELLAFHDDANKNMLDHMIADGMIRPLIVVAATWNVSPDTPTDNLKTWSGTGSGTQQREAYWKDFRNDLMPAIETQYRTYAGLTDSDSAKEKNQRLLASRAHRGFSGFSYGGVTTWWQFQKNFDYIRYYAPFSAYSSALISELEEAVENSAGKDRSFEICTVTGTNDVLYSATTETMNEVFNSSVLTDNAVYYILKGAAHDFEGYQRYLYKALQVLFSE